MSWSEAEGPVAVLGDGDSTDVAVVAWLGGETVVVATAGGGGGAPRVSDSAVVRVVPGAPELAWVVPNTFVAGASPGTLTAVGANATRTVVTWNGTALESAIADPGSLFHPASARGTAPAALLADAGSADVALVTAPPGGGGSASIPVYVVDHVPDRFASVSAGGFHSCALDPDGRGWCWGTAQAGPGAAPGDGGGAPRRPIPVPVHGGPPFATLEAGSERSCGLTPAGAAWCWGWGVGGTLGAGNQANRPGGLAFDTLALGGEVACGLVDGAAWCWGRLPDPVSAPTPVDTGQRFVELAVGDEHACGLTADGSAWCWGANPDGGLGVADTGYVASPEPVVGGVRFQTLDATDDTTCGLRVDGAAFCWGAWHLDPGPGHTLTVPLHVAQGTTFRALSTGAARACGLTEDGAAYCWDGSDPAAEVPGGHVWSTLSAGREHTCGVTRDGAVWCWGFNEYGQLGTDRSLDPPGYPRSAEPLPLAFGP